MKKEDFISIGKITNFFGIKGEAKVGFDNENQIKNAKSVFILDDESCCELKIKSIRFHKNFAIIKFEEIDDINDLLQFKGQRLFVEKQAALKQLEKDEYLIQDLIGCFVYDERCNSRLLFRFRRNASNWNSKRSSRTA